jgi:hypothetical protein
MERQSHPCKSSGKPGAAPEGRAGWELFNPRELKQKQI